MSGLYFVTHLVVWASAVGSIALTQKEECPRCDNIFFKLATTSTGERVQLIDMIERGEPKSGTTFMLDWSRAALLRTCDFLKESFGNETCRMDQPAWGVVTLTFEPHKADENAKCSCNSVDRVEIISSRKDKHTLPVSESCAWSHHEGIARETEGCVSIDERPIENYKDTWRCMVAAECQIIEDRLQFVIFRDPRAEAVSTYFYELATNYTGDTNAHDFKNVDDFVLAFLPRLCQWLTVRYILFEGLMASRSNVFWYEDAVNDPIQWHHRWLNSVGVHLPAPVVQLITEAALRGDLGFHHLGRDPHPHSRVGDKGLGVVSATKKTWKEEIRPETIELVDEIARKWLPPAVLAKLNILS